MKFLILNILLSSSAMAQTSTDPQAVKLLKGTESYYSGKPMEVSFSYSWKAAESREIVEKGTLVFTDQWYRLKLPDQEICFDGIDQWTYFIDRREVQISRSSLAESAFHPLKFAGLYRESGFKSRIVQEENGLAVVELIPENRDQEYHRIRISVIRSTRQIRKIEVFLKNGDQYRIDLLRHMMRKSLKKTDFQLNTANLQGIHLEDLR